MARRKTINPKLAAAVGSLSRRRCCVCVYLHDRDEVVRSQIAHLNHDASDDSFDNLIWLCMNHHDEYDSKTSQSKNLTGDELRTWRLRLVRKFEGPKATWSAELADIAERPRRAKAVSAPKPEAEPWRFPLWQVEDQMDLFAYTAPGSDGVCLIERIDLANGRTVVACLQPAGNPGASITNSAEYIATQACARFEIDPKALVWLEHYPGTEPDEWSLVTFTWQSRAKKFVAPKWRQAKPKDWTDLGLRPLPDLRIEGAIVHSKLAKSADKIATEALAPLLVRKDPRKAAAPAKLALAIDISKPMKRRAPRS